MVAGGAVEDWRYSYIDLKSYTPAWSTWTPGTDKEECRERPLAAARGLSE